MIKRKLSLWGLGILVLTHLSATAQRRWDGEAGDSLWTSEKNWFPDGMPSATEDVVLDHSLSKESYKVLLPGGAISVLINSLHINPSPGKTIAAEIPYQNTASPAITLSATTTALIIGEGAALINRSGAAAGNTIVLMGALLIRKGGKYVHQTIRGNASIVSRLATGKEAEEGLVEFDVPGSANYTLSLSGRRFGSLCLKAGHAERKTYTGSGSNNLFISSDLVVGEGCSFNSALTGSMYIGRKLSLSGNMLINPSTGDSSGRELIFSGDSCLVEITGDFSQGPHFRNIAVLSGVMQLKSNLTLSHDSVMFLLRSGAGILMDTFAIAGRGKFKSENASLIILGSLEGIARDTGKGNIRLTEIFINKTTRMHFNGKSDQVTGRAFPDTIGLLGIALQSGNLTLSKPLDVLEEIRLNRGKIISRDSAVLSLQGSFHNGSANEYGWVSADSQCFVDGPLRLRSDSATTLYFPVGRDNVFAPVVISCSPPTGSWFEVAYFPYRYPLPDASVKLPLGSVSHAEHWTIRETPVATETEPGKRKYIFGLNDKSLTGINGQPQVIHINQQTNHIKTLPLLSNNPFPNTLGSSETESHSGVFAMGGIMQEALNPKIIRLTQSKKGPRTDLQWEILLDKNIQSLVIEKSKDGKDFTVLDAVPFAYQKAKGDYPIGISLKGNFFRIRITDDQGISHLSNVVYVREETENLAVFPNPVQEKILIKGEGTNSLEIIGILSPSGTMIGAPATRTKEGMVFGTAILQKGMYWMVLRHKGKKLSLPFIKQ